MTFNADTYIKVDSLPLRDFWGSELSDQRPVEKMSLLRPVPYICSVELFAVDQGHHSGNNGSDGSLCIGCSRVRLLVHAFGAFFFNMSHVVVIEKK